MSSEAPNKDNMENSSPVYIRELPPYTSEDEISLTDLALILVRRKFLFLTILLICIGLAVAYTATLKKNYTYTTHISIGSYLVEGRLVHLDLPENLLTKITYSFIPEVKINPDYNYSMTASIIDKSNIIAIVASSTTDENKLLISALNKVNQLVIKDQDRLYNTLLHASELFSNASSQTLNPALSQTGVPGLQRTYVLTEPQFSGATRKSPKLIIFASIFIGLFLGMIAVFLAEFISKVRSELNSPS